MAVGRGCVPQNTSVCPGSVIVVFGHAITTLVFDLVFNAYTYLTRLSINLAVCLLYKRYKGKTHKTQHKILEVAILLGCLLGQHICYQGPCAVLCVTF